MQKLDFPEFPPEDRIIDEPENDRQLQENSFHPDRKLEEALGELGRISQSCRSLSWQEARESFRESLTTLAKEFSLDIGTGRELITSVDSFVGGDEHINVMVASQPERVFKITHSDQFGCRPFFDPHDRELTGKHFLAKGNDDPWFYLERWRLLNSIGEYETRFEGIIAPERENWLPRFCVSQPVLIEKNPTEREIEKSLEGHGFHCAGSGAYYSSELNILLTDAYPRNVRVHQGIPALFDAIACEPTEEMKLWLRDHPKDTFPRNE